MVNARTNTGSFNYSACVEPVAPRPDAFGFSSTGLNQVLLLGSPNPQAHKTLCQRHEYRGKTFLIATTNTWSDI